MYILKSQQHCNNRKSITDSERHIRYIGNGVDKLPLSRNLLGFSKPTLTSPQHSYVTGGPQIV